MTYQVKKLYSQKKQKDYFVIEIKFNDDYTLTKMLTNEEYYIITKLIKNN